MARILESDSYCLQVVEFNEYKVIKATCNVEFGSRLIILNLALQRAQNVLPAVAVRLEAVLTKLEDGTYTVTFSDTNLQCCIGYNKNEIIRIWTKICPC